MSNINPGPFTTRPVIDGTFGAISLPAGWSLTFRDAGNTIITNTGAVAAGGNVLVYADVDVPMLARMFDRRCRGYEAVGYTVLLPASAIPGWPTDVVLPSDPVWKRDYSGSVRRLVRDGVDAPPAVERQLEQSSHYFLPRL